MTIEPDGTKLWVIQARHEAGDRRLAGAGRPDQRRQLTWLDPEGNISERRRVAGRIAEGDVVKLQRTTRLRQGEGMRLFVDLHRQIHVLENSLEERQRADDVDLHVGELADWPVQAAE